MVAYWARLTALQKGLEIDKSSPDALAILLPLMEWLESQKKVGSIVAWSSMYGKCISVEGAQGERRGGERSGGIRPH